MTKYMMIFRETPEEYGKRSDPERSEAYWAGWMAYVKAMNEAGLVESGAGLQSPETAAVVRISEDGRNVQDGPYADAKEQLGGYFVLKSDDLDEVLAWAARAPCASAGSVEVRPVLENG